MKLFNHSTVNTSVQTEAICSEQLLRLQTENKAQVPILHRTASQHCLLQFFMQRPEAWISVSDLTKELNSYTIAPKITALRRLGYEIENKQEQRQQDGIRRVASSYRYIPEGGVA